VDYDGPEPFRGAAYPAGEDPFEDHEDHNTKTIETLYESAQTWMSLVGMVGGLIVFYKCNWQLLLDWKEQREGPMRVCHISR